MLPNTSSNSKLGLSNTAQSRSLGNRIGISDPLSSAPYPKDAHLLPNAIPRRLQYQIARASCAHLLEKLKRGPDKYLMVKQQPIGGGVQAKGRGVVLNIVAKSPPKQRFTLGHVGSALVVSADRSLVSQFSDALKSIDVVVTNTHLVRDALELIHGQKFEVFVFDTALDTTFLDLLSEVRLSSNSHAVILAVATPGSLCETARTAGANFVLETPLTSESINRTVKAAYGMIVRERRRHFRHPVKLSATVYAAVTGDIVGETVNLSEEGMGIRLPYTLGLGTEVLVRFKLPGHTAEIVARANLNRNGENGMAGLRFLQMPNSMKGLLHEWLSLRLEESIPSLGRKFAHIS